MIENSDGPIYLDYAATTPVDPRVLEVMLPYFTQDFGNASSKHKHGEIAKRAVENAQLQVANLINANPEELVFTSGATEAINLALKGLYFQHFEKRNKIVTVKTEHKAVLDTCAYLEEMGAEVVYLNVDMEGIIKWDEVEKEIDEHTLVVCVMHVNNETGVIQNIRKIASLAKANGAYFFTDATQSFGKLPLDVTESQIDLLSFSAHKIYGPKGVGGLYIRRGIQLQLLIHGGGQQSGLRAGTINVPLIVGLGEAARIAKYEMNENLAKVAQLRDEFETILLANNKIAINGKRDQRSPYISNIQLLEWDDTEEFLMKNQEKLSASTGSACNAEIIEPSHVIKAMYFEYEEYLHQLRISLYQKSDLSFLIEIIKSNERVS